MPNSALSHVECHHGLSASTRHFSWYVSQLPSLYVSFWLTTTIDLSGLHKQECVPVILSDQIELPFQNVIDYTEISIKWPATRIGPELLEYLESISGNSSTSSGAIHSAFSMFWWLTMVVLYLSDEDINQMIAQGRRMRCLFVYEPETEPCSAIHGILWELQRKVRQFEQSTETFWLHNKTIVNRELLEFDSWTPPMPLPWNMYACFQTINPDVLWTVDVGIYHEGQ